LSALVRSDSLTALSMTSWRRAAELKSAGLRIKLDTTRLRRRVDSKLELLMGKMPKVSVCRLTRLSARVILIIRIVQLLTRRACDGRNGKHR
jgi:hypothetical protein